MEQNLTTANQKLDELLGVHKDHPMTTNHEFSVNRDKFQKVRAEKGDSGETVADMDRMAAEEAYDNMRAYYQVCLLHVVD
jgi:hypothetical protein